MFVILIKVFFINFLIIFYIIYIYRKYIILLIKQGNIKKIFWNWYSHLFMSKIYDFLC